MDAEFGMTCQDRLASLELSGAPQLSLAISRRREEFDAQVERVGAVLLRGCAAASPDELHAVARMLAPATLPYVGGNSPRRKLAGDVYTSTEYPAEAEISLHGELSYAARWPTRLFFHCRRPADAGGETPLAHAGRVLQRIPTAVRQRFESRGVRYVQNLHGGRGLGRSWQETFETRAAAAAESICRSAGCEFAWRGGGGLRIIQRRPAIRRHPLDGELVWFNQAEQWHPSSLLPESRELLAELVSEEDFPHDASFGDGSPLLAEDLAEVRDAMRAESFAFSWRAGDLLVLDNMRVAHGRRPFRGEREVWVVMGGCERVA